MLYNIVIQVIDKVNLESDAMDSKHPKVGDVIDIIDASVNIGTNVYLESHNFWRVLQADLNYTEVDHLIKPEPGDRKVNLLLQFRQHHLDLSAFSNPVRNAIASNPKVPIPVTRLELLAASKPRGPRAILIGK